MIKLFFLLTLASLCFAQPSLTTVSSTITNADGTPFTGKVTIVAQAIQSGTVSVRSAPILPTVVGGVLTVQLAANDTTYPTGTPYYVVFQPTRGTPYSENWGVPQGGPYTIIQVLQPSASVAASINTLLNGTSTPPSNTLGNNGDMYLDTTHQCLWGPKSHAAWTGPCVSIRGPTGSTGSTGATGPPVTFRGAWLIGTAYLTGDSVSYLGSSYIALSGNTGLEPDTNPGSWGILARVGNTGPSGATGAQGGPLVTGASLDGQYPCWSVSAGTWILCNAGGGITPLFDSFSGTFDSISGSSFDSSTN